jgi:dihydrofolate synthase/folylpolyglutamate synthase
VDVMNDDPVGWLYDLQHSGIKLGLDNIRALLDVLDHPEHSYPSVLIAGTNGKGSVAAMLESMLLAHGIRTGMFTSPHLVRPNERIRIHGRDISDNDLNGLLIEMRTRIENGVARGALDTCPSFFEVVTATALQAFKEHRVGCGVLEIGMGGRLDATNAVDAVMSIVVTIDYDHTEKLGGTLQSIAAEKAATVKPGRPLVSGVEREEARAVLAAAAAAAGSPLIDAGRIADLVHAEGERFSILTPRQRYTDLTVPLRGRHQIENARVAVVSLETLAPVLGIDPDPSRVREGLAKTRWPGRLQWVEGRPPLLLDGAHNPAGSRALAEYLRTRDGERRVLLFNTMRKKKVEEMIEPLADRIDAVVITRASVERAAEPEDLAPVLERFVARVEIVPDPAEALDRARALALPDGYVLVAGSLYLIGEILALAEDSPVPGPVPM